MDDSNSQYEALREEIEALREDVAALRRILYIVATTLALVDGG
jgi:prefoldin subunit 5